jgi:hypothetical protein
MIGWIIAISLYGLGALFVFKCSNDSRLLRALMWPFVVIGLAITGILILASTPPRAKR